MSGDGMDNGSDKLHEVMARATDGISGIRADMGRMLRARRKRRWQEAGAVAGVLSVVLAVAGFTLRQGGSDGGSGPIRPGSGSTSPAVHSSSDPHAVPSTPFASPPTAAPVAVEVYDADDGTEGTDTLSAFMTGKGPWLSRVYCQSHPTLDGQVKPGTGLVFDLGRPMALDGVGFSGFRGVVEFWTADSSVTAMPRVVRFHPPAGFHKAATMTPQDSKYAKAEETTRFVLVWFTELPGTDPNATKAVCAGDSGDRFEGRIDHIYFFPRQ